MKMIRLTTATVLTSILLAGGVTSLANEIREVETDGKVLFVPNTDEPIVVEPPETGPGEPGGPDVEIPPVGPPGGTGPLAIAYAPTMDFGTQVITNQDMAYNMVAERQQLSGTTGDENKVPYISFAQIQDQRGNNAGWELAVTLSAFESGTQNNELQGVEIELVSPRLHYSGNAATHGPSVHSPGMRLSATGDKQVIAHAPDGRGAGTSSVIWGDQAALDAQVAAGDEVIENDGIKLHVPGASPKDAAVYEATLTWSLTSSVDEGGETVPAG